MSQSKKSPGLGAVFLTLFIDLIGFSLIFTLIPALLDYYIPGFITEHTQAFANSSSQPDTVAIWFRDFCHTVLVPWAADSGLNASESRQAVFTFIGGILAGIFSLLQFFAAPYWGRLSDRIGRKKTLIITISGNALAYLVWAFAPTFTLLLVSRFLAGLFSGNISVATALVADLTDEKNRTKGMGFAGMAIGFGFLLGPPLGMVLFAGLPLEGLSPLFNPFSSVALAAAALCLLNLYQMRKLLPDPPVSQPSDRGRSTVSTILHLNENEDYLPGYRSTLFIQFIYIVFFAGFEFTLSFYFAFHHGFAKMDLAWLFLYSGLILALSQGGISRRLSGKVQEKWQLTAGMVLFVLGFALYAYSVGDQPGRDLWSGLAGVGIISLAAGIVSPAISAQASLTFHAQRQGLGLGIFRSFGSLARVVGPFAGGFVYLTGGPRLLFVYCLVLAAILLWPILRLPLNRTSPS